MERLEKAILDRIEAIGEAKGIITDHWKEDPWEEDWVRDLSKHNKWFHTPFGEESDKLDECRRRMKYYEGLLEKICSVLTTE